VWRDFLDAVEQRRPPRIGGAQALEVHRLIDALLASGGAGHPVRLP
jgi:UDP-N-acetyl-2-amino-2-deoxyglucuronate dehydrogenase